MATHSFRRNYIASLVVEDGSIVSDQEMKAGVLWNSYRERLGIFEFNEMLFDLTSLIQSVQLPVLDEPFSKEEIDRVIKEIVPDHAPGPD